MYKYPKTNGISAYNVSEKYRLLSETHFPLNKSSTKFIRLGYNWFDDFHPAMVLWDRVTNGQIFLTPRDLCHINLFVSGTYYSNNQQDKEMQLTNAIIKDYMKGDLRIIKFIEHHGTSQIACSEATVKTMLKYQNLYLHTRQNIELRFIVEELFNFLNTSECDHIKTHSDLSKNFSFIAEGIGSENTNTLAEIFYKFPETTTAILEKKI